MLGRRASADFMKTELPTLNETGLRRLKLAGIVAGALFTVVLVSGVLLRVANFAAVERWTRAAAIPSVAVVVPSQSGLASTLDLPGALKANFSAPLYARVPGYVRTWSVDIGSRVRKGQVLAVIDTPELDQQIAQAKADLASARAAQRLAVTSASRWRSLLAADAVSKQETQEKQSDLVVRNAIVAAAEAALRRLQSMKAFAELTAPFDGVVTARAVDIGMLINSGAQSAPPLFVVSDVSRMRVYVNIPQSYSGELSIGQQAFLSLPEYPGKIFPARLAATSGAIDARNGTLQAEFLAPNPDGRLRPGDYAQVTIRLATAVRALSVPPSVLILGADGARVAVVGGDGHIHMKSVRITHDYGTAVAIEGPIGPREQIVTDPSPTLAEGDIVQSRTAP